MDFKQHVIVIGGGIAGLSAAYTLMKKNRELDAPAQITVFEADPRWGGKIVTDRVDGFVIEGGPDTFLASKPWAVALCKELGLAERLHGTNPQKRNTYILCNGRLRPLPDGLMMMVPSKFGPMIRTGLLSWPQKTRMGLDFFLPPRPLNGDESLGEFVSRRLGRAAYERLIEPLMSGIYAGDGDQLSLQATFPYLRDMELKNGGLIRGALAYRKKMSANGKKKTGSRSVFLTPTTGLAEIVEALVERLEEGGVNLQCASPVKRVLKAGGGYRIELESGEALEAGAVILASPAYASGEMLASLDPELAEALQAIPYASTATITLAYRQEDLPRELDGYGYVIPRAEGRRALACTWTSTKFPHRAPEGYALVRVFAGRAGQEAEIDFAKESLLELAREELRHTLGITSAPVLTRIFTWDRAMPQYNLGHPERLKKIETALARWPGLALAGNGYRGIGIPDCIRSGEEAAAKVVGQS